MKLRKAKTSTWLRVYRVEAWEKQDCKCFYCKNPISRSEVTADHYVAKKCHGNNERENIVASCMPCNTIKGSLDGKTFQKLLKKPDLRNTSFPIYVRAVIRSVNIRIEKAERKLQRVR